MRRIVPVLTILFLLGATARSAYPRVLDDDRGRSAAAEYIVSPGTSGAPSVYWAGSPAGNVGGVQFKLHDGEHFVTVHVTDGAGLPVHGEIDADLDGVEQTSEVIAEFCGATDSPVELPDVERIRVIVKSGSCDGGPALATSGRVKVRFSGLP